MMDYDLRHGRTYMYFKGKPLYPFGYGLSYTSFQYSNLKLSAKEIGKDSAILLNVDVRNNGSRAGDEVVQMYVTHKGSKVERPQEELKGFQRVKLEPGKKTTVKLPLKASDLAYWSVEKGVWVVESDEVEVMVGSSSADVKLRTTIRVKP
jgi:beta-glucosidase